MSRPTRHTKIVATLGPASADADVIEALVRAGMDVARLNASHGDHAFFTRAVGTVREAAGRVGREVAILLDLRGPKVRVGRLEGGGPVRLEENATIIISTAEFEGNASRLPCTYAGLPGDLERGDRILLDDGLLELRVVGEPSATEIPCEVVVGGMLKPNKGINVPGRPLSAAAFDEKDLRDLSSALELGVDLVALSFVRRGTDIADLRREMVRRGGVLPIIAKIEKPQALESIDEILQETEGIMVARGDLGVEVEPEKVPQLQKRLIQKANEHGRPVITATQMLESMIEHRRPTRAEASDVANAIFDGTDAVMLSGETAAGRYPVRAVEMMAKIAAEAEASEFYRRPLRDPVLPGADRSLIAMAKAARQVVDETGPPIVVVYTLSGRTAVVLSKFLRGVTIVALSPDPSTCRRMALVNGVVPLRSAHHENTDDMLAQGDRRLLASGLVEPGETVVVLGGTLRLPGATHLLQLRKVEHRDGKS